MLVNRVTIQNFRAHNNTVIEITNLCCLIGENNAGKSTVLHALQYAFEGGKFSPEDFGDSSQPIRIDVTLSDISVGDLERIENEEHRRRINDIVQDGTITLVRSGVIFESSQLQYLAPESLEERFRENAVEQILEANTASELPSALKESIPEVLELIDGKPGKRNVRDARLAFIRTLTGAQVVLTPHNFPTGISAAIRPLLPEVIYIEAVKDVSQETRTSDSATFGKLLKLLLAEVSPQFNDLEKSFKEIQRKLSRVEGASGDAIDQRLQPVKLVENTIAGYIQESFPEAILQMQVPAPSLSTILSGASLWINDGHDGPVSGKGDGLKRTVLFAILRAYTTLRERGLSTGETASGPSSSYLLLFEEPELYLHPKAQRQLMAALSRFSEEYTVVATTHSPSFFSTSTTGFTKLEKQKGDVVARDVDLGRISNRDAYQIVRYENNDAAFFARQVVLVEGDSDVFTFPHLARLLDPTWDDRERNIVFVKIDGKGNVRRYRDFFAQFGVPIHTIVDGDALVDDFAQLTDDSELLTKQSAMKSKLLETGEAFKTASSRDVKSAIKSRDGASTWFSIQTKLDSLVESPGADNAREIRDELTELFSRRLGSKTASSLFKAKGELAQLRDELVYSMAEVKVHILRFGDLEAYCGGATDSRDKVSGAIKFCEDTKSEADWVRGIDGDSAEYIEDLRRIFTLIYRDAADANPKDA